MDWVSVTGAASYEDGVLLIWADDELKEVQLKDYIVHHEPGKFRVVNTQQFLDWYDRPVEEARPGRIRYMSRLNNQWTTEVWK